MQEDFIKSMNVFVEDKFGKIGEDEISVFFQNLFEIENAQQKIDAYFSDKYTKNLGLYSDSSKPGKAGEAEFRLVWLNYHAAIIEETLNKLPVQLADIALLRNVFQAVKKMHMPYYLDEDAKKLQDIKAKICRRIIGEFSQNQALGLEQLERNAEACLQKMQFEKQLESIKTDTGIEDVIIVKDGEPSGTIKKAFDAVLLGIYLAAESVASLYQASENRIFAALADLKKEYKIYRAKFDSIKDDHAALRRLLNEFRHLAVTALARAESGSFEPTPAKIKSCEQKFNKAEQELNFSKGKNPFNRKGFIVCNVDENGVPYKLTAVERNYKLTQEQIELGMGSDGVDKEAEKKIVTVSSHYRGNEAGRSSARNYAVHTVYDFRNAAATKSVLVSHGSLAPYKTPPKNKGGEHLACMEAALSMEQVAAQQAGKFYLYDQVITPWDPREQHMFLNNMLASLMQNDFVYLDDPVNVFRRYSFINPKIEKSVSGQNAVSRIDLFLKQYPAYTEGNDFKLYTEAREKAAAACKVYVEACKQACEGNNYDKNTEQALNHLRKAALASVDALHIAAKRTEKIFIEKLNDEKNKVTDVKDKLIVQLMQAIYLLKGNRTRRYNLIKPALNLLLGEMMGGQSGVSCKSGADRTAAVIAAFEALKEMDANKLVQYLTELNMALSQGAVYVDDEGIEAGILTSIKNNYDRNEASRQKANDGMNGAPKCSPLVFHPDYVPECISDGQKAGNFAAHKNTNKKAFAKNEKIPAFLKALENSSHSKALRTMIKGVKLALLASNESSLSIDGRLEDLEKYLGTIENTLNAKPKFWEKFKRFFGDAKRESFEQLKTFVQIQKNFLEIKKAQLAKGEKDFNFEYFIKLIDHKLSNMEDKTSLQYVSLNNLKNDLQSQLSPNMPLREAAFVYQKLMERYELSKGDGLLVPGDIEVNIPSPEAFIKQQLGDYWLDVKSSKDFATKQFICAELEKLGFDKNALSIEFICQFNPALIDGDGQKFEVLNKWLNVLDKIANTYPEKSFDDIYGETVRSLKGIYGNSLGDNSITDVAKLREAIEIIEEKAFIQSLGLKELNFVKSLDIADNIKVEALSVDDICKLDPARIIGTLFDEDKKQGFDALDEWIGILDKIKQHYPGKSFNDIYGQTARFFAEVCKVNLSENAKFENFDGFRRAMLDKLNIAKKNPPEEIDQRILGSLKNLGNGEVSQKLNY